MFIADVLAFFLDVLVLLLQVQETGILCLFSALLLFDDIYTFFHFFKSVAFTFDFRFKFPMLFLDNSKLILQLPPHRAVVLTFKFMKRFFHFFALFKARNLSFQAPHTRFDLV